MFPVLIDLGTHDLPLLAATAAVWIYWIIVGAMSWRVRRRTRRLALDRRSHDHGERLRIRAGRRRQADRAGLHR